MSPWKSKHYCAFPLCSTLIEPGQSYCDKHKEYKQASRKQYDKTRGTSTERGYSARWVRASKMYLRSHPLCAECKRNNIIRASECVDHIKPHKGNYELFWNEDNWQALCFHHHNAKSGRGE